MSVIRTRPRSQYSADADALVPFDGNRPPVASAWELDDFTLPDESESRPEPLALAKTDPPSLALEPRATGRRSIRAVAMLVVALGAAGLLYMRRPSAAVGGAEALRLTGVLMASDVVVSSLTPGRI